MSEGINRASYMSEEIAIWLNRLVTIFHVAPEVIDVFNDLWVEESLHMTTTPFQKED